MATPQVTGVREALAALKEFDPKLRRETTKKIRSATGPLESAVRGKLPGLPMSNWRYGRYAYDQGAASSGVRTRVGRGRGGGKTSLVSAGRSSWPLVDVEQRNAGGAVFDMAGRRSSGSSPQGRQFILNLNRHGRASRSMWPAAEQNLDAVQSAVVKAIDAAAKATNREIGRR